MEAGFDQLVFRYSFEQGLTGQDCLRVLSTEFPDVTRQQLSRAISRVHGVLTPRQRWQIGVRHRRKRFLGDPVDDSRLQEVSQLSTPTQGPASMAQKQQELDTLKAALAKLSDRQRLLLYLRFHAGLALNQIVQFVPLGDSNRAWRHIEKALKALSDQFPPDQFPSEKFPDIRKK